MNVEEARALLGLSPDHDPGELRRARRRAMIDAHPDHGGSFEMLKRVEAAFAALQPVNDSPSRAISPQRNDRVRKDAPSFTIDVLPVEAFEYLLLASAELGDIVDEDAPYRLEIRVNHPHEAWVVLDVVPDAGGSTVSITCDGEQSVESMRDLWIQTINGLQRL